MGEDGIQDALYRAAQQDDRDAVGLCLRRIFMESGRDDETKAAFAATIDIAARNMATLSLFVLSLQGNATGLFRHLAEKDPAEIRRIGPPLVAAFENLLFVRPLVELGADPAFMNGRLFAKAVAEDAALAGWMLENGLDAQSPENAAALAALDAAASARQRAIAGDSRARLAARAKSPGLSLKP